MTPALSTLRTTLVAGAACLALSAAALADGHVAKIISGLDRPEAEVARPAPMAPLGTVKV